MLLLLKCDRQTYASDAGQLFAILLTFILEIKSSNITYLGEKTQQFGNQLHQWLLKWYSHPLNGHSLHQNDAFNCDVLHQAGILTTY